MDFTKMSVDEIRAEIIKLGVPEELANSIKGKGKVIDAYNQAARSLEPDASQKSLPFVGMEELGGEPDTSAGFNKIDVVESVAPIANVIPTDIAWHDYVMGHFAEDELVEDKNSKKKLPNVDGLRRVAQLLIGPIIKSTPTVHKSPTTQDISATVSYSVIFDAWGTHKEFGGAGDCSHENTDTTYARHAVAVAETKAEARALRKALGLRKILAAEEASMEPVPVETWLDDCITGLQLDMIEKKCKESDIDVLKFLNMGKKQYPDYRKIPADTAREMCREINELSREAKPVPEEIKGFKEGWR